MDTIQSPFFKRVDARWIPAIGVVQHFANGLSGVLSYRFYRFTGGNIAHQVGHAHAHNDHTHHADEAHEHNHPTSTKSSDLNSDEIALELEWESWYGELSWMWRPNKLENSKNVILRLGHVYKVGRLHLDGSVFFVHHEQAEKQRFNHFQFVGSYQFKNGVQPYAGFTIGGKSEENHSIDPQWFVGANYHF